MGYSTGQGTPQQSRNAQSGLSNLGLADLPDIQLRRVTDAFVCAYIFENVSEGARRRDCDSGEGNRTCM
jgi:hypothetical protein